MRPKFVLERIPRALVMIDFLVHFLLRARNLTLRLAKSGTIAVQVLKPEN
jgi:hypothetical protein